MLDAVTNGVEQRKASLWRTWALFAFTTNDAAAQAMTDIELRQIIFAVARGRMDRVTILYGKDNVWPPAWVSW